MVSRQGCLKLLVSSVLFVGSIGDVHGSEKCIPYFFRHVAAQESIPADKFYALALQESGMKMQDGSFGPWPYVINHKGKAFVYPDYQALVLGANEFVGKGYLTFDVGYFQVNWRWHSERVKSLAHFAHPVVNARVAAQIFREQYRKHGDWSVAAGRYHNPSNTNGFADRYESSYRDWVVKIGREYRC